MTKPFWLISACFAFLALAIAFLTLNPMRIPALYTQKQALESITIPPGMELVGVRSGKVRDKNPYPIHAALYRVRGPITERRLELEAAMSAAGFSETKGYRASRRSDDVSFHVKAPGRHFAHVSFMPAETKVLEERLRAYDATSDGTAYAEIVISPKETAYSELLTED